MLIGYSPFILALSDISICSNVYLPLRKFIIWFKNTSTTHIFPSTMCSIDSLRLINFVIKKASLYQTCLSNCISGA